MDCRRICAWIGRRVGVVCFAGLGLTAQAGVTLSHFPPNPGLQAGGGWKMGTGTTFSNPPPPRAWTNGVYGSVPQVVATDSMVLNGPAGNLAVQVAQRVSLLDAGMAIASVLSPQVGAALSVGQMIFNAARIMNETDTGGGPLMRDPGQPPVSSAGLEYGSGCTSQAAYVRGADPSSAWFGSPEAVASYCSYNLNGANYSARVSSSECRGSASPCVLTHSDQQASWQQDTVDSLVSRQGAASRSCPASIDPLDPSKSIPAGSDVGPDGLCQTARYNHKPITLQAASEAVQGLPTTTPDALTTGLQEAVSNANATAPAEVSVIGPASQVGQPTQSVTVNPDGSTVTTTSTPSFNYKYQGDIILMSGGSKVDVQTCTGSGACSTSTTTTVSAPSPKVDPVDPCTVNPESLGCMKLGDVPTGEVVKRQKDVAFSVDQSNGSLPVGCPQPDVNVHGNMISYQPICDAAVRIKPFIIISAIFTSLMLSLAAVRQI